MQCLCSAKHIQILSHPFLGDKRKGHCSLNTSDPLRAGLAMHSALGLPRKPTVAVPLTAYPRDAWVRS